MFAARRAFMATRPAWAQVKTEVLHQKPVVTEQVVIETGSLPYITPSNSQWKHKTLIGTRTDEEYRWSKFWMEQPNLYQRFLPLLGIGFTAGWLTSTFGIEF